MVGADRSWLWALTPDTLTTIELPGRARIEPAARAVYEAFAARQRRPNESAATYSRRVERAQSLLARRSQALSQMLFGGIAGRLNRDWRGRRLAIVTSDVLDYLPFAALPEPDADTGRPRRAAARPLIASHEIVRLPSASVLAALRQEAQGRRPAPHAVAILADPVFDASDPRVAARPRPAAVHAASASASPLLADHALGQAKLPRLPFSRAEAEAVASLAGARDLLDAVDFDASRETALSARLGDYRIVHFATHGVLDTERPSLSGLVLSLLDKSGKPQNGYLRLPDIYNMRLNADLVVLSACDTALGKQIRGEGLISLTRAFMYAGAPRVVASLWQVDDVATAELMKRFYAGMLKQGLRPAAALRAAQLDISRDPRWTSPYYWAGFVVEGDWK
jgi:CHAT domain-containing protein